MNEKNSGCASLSPNVWEDVKADIEHKILIGTFAAGERIPSIRKIADDYNVGQSTAHKILAVLHREGIIESKRGVGYFVNPFIREKLLAERKKNLEKSVLWAVREASLIGVDIRPMVEQYWEKAQK